MDGQTEVSERVSPAGAWLMAARPKTLPAAATPVIIGFALAYGEGFSHWPSLAAAMCGALLIQIGTNFANDYYDFVKGADTEERVGPVRATQAGLISPGAMKGAMALAFGLALVPGAYIIFRGGWPFLLIGVLSIGSGILYTGGPYPLGYLGLGDLFVLIFFGPVAVGGTYYLQTMSLDLNVVVAGFAPGFISVAILSVNNLRDMEGDRAVGKKTLAVRFGATFAKVEYVGSLFVGAALIPVVLCIRTGGHWYALASVVTIVAGAPTIRVVFQAESGAALNSALARTGQLLLLFGIVFSVGWLL